MYSEETTAVRPWSFIGFLNFLPFYPWDGGKIFIEIASRFINESSLGVAQAVSYYAILFFVFIVGVSNSKFVDYFE